MKAGGEEDAGGEGDGGGPGGHLHHVGAGPEELPVQLAHRLRLLHRRLGRPRASLGQNLATHKNTFFSHPNTFTVSLNQKSVIWLGRAVP